MFLFITLAVPNEGVIKNRIGFPSYNLKRLGGK